MNVIGVDLSTHYLDFVRLRESEDVARWHRFPLPPSPTKVELARSVSEAVPLANWFENVYLVAIEEPMGQNRQAIAALNCVLGALLSSLPPDLQVWLLRPHEWKQGIGLLGNISTQKDPGRSSLLAWATTIGGTSVEWSPDACVALACAYTARETNALAIVKGLEAA